MSQVYTFHKTVQGHLHIMNGFPCEDSSASFTAENGRYHIAIVADGHGSKSCFRSSYGSKAATDVALECLQQFAEAALESENIEKRFYKDMFSHPRYRQMTIRRLTDTIIAGWHDRVLEDYKNNPPSIEEMGENAAEYESGRNTAHIYGTTLIASLQLPKCLILVHQGDGRCEVLYTDGSVEQPIPWDARCEDTATTSLCDEDAADSLRGCVINLEEHPVMACYLGSDGVEDAYRDTYEELGGSHVLMGGVHTFYKDLTCQLAAKGQTEFEDYLKTMLPEFSTNGRFSRSGSGDDVSVAGIVDLDIIQKFVAKFEDDVKIYALEEELFWKKDELRGKTRKRGILQKRVDEAQSALNEAQTKQRDSEIRLQKLKIQRKKNLQKAEEAKAELEENAWQSESSVKHLIENSNLVGYCYRSQFKRQDIDVIGVGLKEINSKIQILSRGVLTVCSGHSKKETSYRKIQEKVIECDEQIRSMEELQSEGADKIRELEDQLAEAQSAFDEYDAKYQAIDADRIRIENEIAALQEGNQE